jgi:hypothetical protein
VDRKTLLVLGEITTAQYKDAVTCMLTDRYSAQVVRMKPKDFLLDHIELIGRYHESGDVRARARLGLSKDSEEHIHQLIDKHFANFKYPIGAVIMDAKTWDQWSEFSHLTHVLAADRWVVRANGKVEYLG